MIKCVCGVRLFKVDVVDSIYKWFSDGSDKWEEKTHIIYRCPSCFMVKRVKW